MDWQLTDEQRALKETVREFAEKEILPHVREWDEQARFHAELIPQMGELGVLGIVIPEQYGGAGLGYVEQVLAMEELARVDPAVALTVAGHSSLCSNHILQSGSEEQRTRYLPELASGKKLGCWSLTEPGAGSDAGGMRTRAERCPQGWRINGSKTFTTNGGHADVCVVMAITAAGRGHQDISAFLVERGTKGFRAGREERKLGMCSSDTSEMIFEDCVVPQANLLGEEGRGFFDSLHVLDKGRIAIAALSVGLAQGAFEAALCYAQERRQFGKAIAEFQGMQWKLADMATELEASRLLTYQAARRQDAGLSITKEASMAKLFASEAAVRVADQAVQIYGGYGFLKDYPVEKYYRDVKLCTIGEGTSEIQRLVIARQLLQGNV
jgi:alkylation response protein AidB-like acyl-CoA dehydrogenase